MFRSPVRPRDSGIPAEEEDPALPRDSGVPPEDENLEYSNNSSDSSNQSVIMPVNPPAADAGVSLNAYQLAVLSDFS